MRMHSRFRYREYLGVLTIIAVCFVLPGAVASSGGYALLKKIPIPGQGSWDHLTVDEGTRRLYVSHGTQVEVLDVDSSTIAGPDS
jgi:hypothetical protein